MLRIYVRLNAVPGHAFSETDRLMARPEEFAHEPQAISAWACWRNWNRKEITANDGLVRADHPLLLAILDRTQSASSLKRLLRNPLGFVWVYAMHMRTPESGTDPLVLDALGMGDLVHMTLDLALQNWSRWHAPPTPAKPRSRQQWATSRRGRCCLGKRAEPSAQCDLAPNAR